MRRTATLLAATLLLAGCSTPQTGGGEAAPAPTPTPAPSSSTPEPPPPPVQPAGEPQVLASDLEAPWSVVPLEGGGALISERDTALVKELLPDGTVREVGSIAGVEPGGEGGLLGLALQDGWLYAYFTAASDNRIVRMPLSGTAGSYSLGAPEDILTGITKNQTHNGGRIKFGPDGQLYATVGDAQQRDAAQDPASLSGKILRMTPEGDVPADNPTPGSLVYSLGHRNPQGIAWDRDGNLWAAEFGQNTWDELNAITPGGNYGWPVVEGISDNADFLNPVYQWATSDASPSGLAYVDSTLFMAALRGQQLWAIYPGAQTTATGFYPGQFGRIRDAVVAPDGSLWLLTNNTDGRGSPRAGDDKLLRVELAPVG
ncbi:PQQ-dependent sugar dehydrogenase [Herbiconiux sp. SYSU D00978]|uniref:PQQ-dependent sugar dehydrogenase n=1 Tax=Herbiconiux sp. SYSU D00978 TaxID=2812562 RepID=UPI001A96DA3D|nr:PQQ-dependent sugar dehydrogenase [Herbiconiux sp. SYSU D00978]